MVAGNLTRGLMFGFVFLAFAAGAAAQDASRSSSAASANSKKAVGATLNDQLNQISSGVPQLQQKQDLRDTENRGDFVGADAGDTGVFEDDVEGAKDASGQQSGVGSRRSSSTRRSSGLSSQRNQRGRQPQGGLQQRGRQSQGRQSQGQPIRPRLSLGFAYKPVVTPQLGANVQTYIKRLPNFGKNSAVRVSLVKDVVVLEGTVATQHDSMLSQQLIALTPGVNKVENRLKITEAVVAR